ncbi:MAG: tyrosine-protein phosphatase [Leucobacter sp.]|nr:tyrosine-protein phosphatase [Leucobacter sp.]
MPTSVDRRIHLRSASNFRDLGGLPVSGGHIRPREVFRSASLARLTDDEFGRLDELSITTVYDLRTEAERAAQPDRLPDTARAVGLDVLADGTGGVAHAIGRLRDEPLLVNELLKGGKVKEMLEQSYREFIELPSARHSYRTLFLDLADGEREGAALFHCTAGKDRTGWAAAALLLLLGADDSTVRSDYLQTNTDFLPTLKPLFESAAARGVDTDLLREAFSVQDSYLATSLEQVARTYGSIEDYFLRGLQIDAAAIDALRERFIA